MDARFASMMAFGVASLKAGNSARLPRRQKLKRRLKGKLAEFVLVLKIGWFLASVSSAQTFRTLYSMFTGKSDGQGPVRLILSGNTLFGTVNGGGLWGSGAVFALNTDGSNFRILHHFTSAINGTNQDGALPLAGMILSTNNNTTLYGTTSFGGLFGLGTVFAINTDGTGYRVLHSFSAGSDADELILLENTLYGTTRAGGDSGAGTVFSITLPNSLPELKITSAAGSIVLTWPTNFTGFVLQSATDLLSSDWTNFPAPVVATGQYTITNPESGTQQFFRLSQ